MEAEGYVYRGRVNGALAVSRALGDTSYKSQKHLPPEIAKMRTEASAEVAELWSSDVTDAFLIIACDGIFEEIDNKQAVALARAAFQKYGVDDVGAVAKSIIEWVMLKGGTDNMTCVIQVLDKDSLKKLDSRTVGSECEACGLAYPAVLNAGAVLRTTARDVRHLDEPGLQRYLKDVGLYAPKVAELAMDGTDLLAADLTSVDLDLSESDAAFLRAALEWWDITSSCAENPKMYAAIGGGGRRASVEKGYY